MSTTRKPFITDMGAPLEITDPQGNVAGHLERYAVWMDRGRGKAEVAEISSDLRGLRQRYGVSGPIAVWSQAKGTFQQGLTATAFILRVPGESWTEQNTSEVEHVIPADVYEAALEGRGNLNTSLVARAVEAYIAEKEGVTLDEVDLDAWPASRGE